MFSKLTVILRNTKAFGSLLISAYHSAGFPYWNFASAQAQKPSTRKSRLGTLSHLIQQILIFVFQFLNYFTVSESNTQALKKGKTYFAAPLRLVTFLVFPLPSLKVVWFATASTPLFMEKSRKHLLRTIQNTKRKQKWKAMEKGSNGKKDRNYG